jgi:hypothetical protein
MFDPRGGPVEPCAPGVGFHSAAPPRAARSRGRVVTPGVGDKAPSAPGRFRRALRSVRARDGGPGVGFGTAIPSSAPAIRNSTTTREEKDGENTYPDNR